MKICGFLWIFLASRISSQKIITCKFENLKCTFTKISVGKNEEVIVNVEPSNINVEEVTHVEFESSSIYTIPPELFQKFVNLQWLKAWNQDVREIGPANFVNARNLQHLDLYNNQLTHIHEHTFKDLTNLKVIFLPQNDLHVLHKNTFIDNLNLEIIHLYNNSLAALHSQMFSHLKKLNNLGLVNTTCTNKWFDNSNLVTVENDLQTCGTGYGVHMLNQKNIEILKAEIDEKIEDEVMGQVSKKLNEISENFAVLTEKMDKIDQHYVKKFENFDEKFTLLTGLYANLDKQTQHNTKTIEKMSKTIEKILEILEEGRAKMSSQHACFSKISK